MRFPCVLFGAVALASGLCSADDLTPATTVICTPEPLICTTFAAGSKDRFEPLVQHLLVRRQLEAQPKGWQMIYVYVPAMDPRALEELLIRFLDELLARKNEKEQERAAQEHARKDAAKEPAEAKP